MDDLSKNRRIVELGNEIQQMPGYKLEQEFFGLDITRYIFDRNFADLSNIVTFITTDPRGASLHVVENRNKRAAFGLEVIRGIYNYTGVAVSLVQHTIKMYERLYEQNNLFPEYHEEAKKIFDAGLLVFIQDFRNYCQHIKSPIISFTTTFPNGKSLNRITIPVSALHRYVEWKAPAKHFIASIHERLDVMEVLTDFHHKEVAFQNWFRTQQVEIHAEELKKLDDKRDELRNLMGDDYIPPA